MALVTVKKIIKKAYENGYAIGQFNVNNLEWGKTILEMAQKHQSPVILGISAGAAKYMGGFKVANDMLVAMIEDMVITIPVVIHLDHGHDQECKKAIAARFTSIMFDGSYLPIEKNLEKTAYWVKVAKENGLSVEGEVGTIGGEEDGIIGDTGEIADPLQCKMMMDLGIDMLAAGIGNIHGRYPKEWKGLNLDVLKSISKITKGLPLVLHGGSGIPKEQIKAAIKLGVAKVNVNTELQLVYSAALKEYFDQNRHKEGKGFDPRKVNGFGMEAVKKEITNKMEIFGSINKAK